MHVIGCDNCLTATYDNEDEVVIFAGVGINAKSPHNGVKNSRVLTDKIPLSNNKVELNFNSIWLKYSPLPETGALFDKGALTV